MKKNSSFEKFMSKEKKGAAKKEQLRQEKRSWKKQLNEKKETKRLEKKKFYDQGGSKSASPKPTFRKKPGAAGEEKSFDHKEKKPFAVSKKSTTSGRPAPTKPGFRKKPTSGSDERNFEQREKKSIHVSKKPAASGRPTANKSGFRAKTDSTGDKGRFDQKDKKVISVSKKPVAGSGKITPEKKAGQAQMPLNKYIAHSGMCSRRDAAELIKGGKVKVNGELITEPGHKVSDNDEVKVSGKRVNPTRNHVYILLNKPKDYITTTDDPQQRKTVLDLIKHATTERIYPVGRLDRNTSGVLLLTNDGDLSQKLTHPSNEVRKLYAVTLDKPLTRNHFDDILKGVPLEDGIAYVDSLAFTDAKDLRQIGIELHSGRNRIVRRIFEHFGYDVKALDRVIFAGLTKKNVDRGKWRFLSEKEVRDLKYFKKGKK